ncbi:UNVERIFIED_CONTAM: hypothetical protein Slati_4506000 [Sesamum latifolium]|uniref:Integrase catalytic domain-containing protein n=1 Tax=Sesamum latifolium TaxID=2727402 RepID=A0AAW2SSP0_9LAMI
MVETDWRKPLLDYLTKGILPANEMEAARLKSRVARFALLDGAMALANKSLRAGYFWPTLNKDAICSAKKCEHCQKHATLIHVPVEPHRALSVPCPFSHWGMDIVGPFPTAVGQRKFLLAVVDYFSKWEKEEPLTRITKNEVIKFLWKNIICRTGVSEQGIQQRFTSVAYPQANGQVQIINRILVQGIKTKLMQAGGQWVDALPGVMWSYRTIPHSTTREIPFNLVYGSEAVIPAEPELKTFRIQHYGQENNNNLLRANLDLIDEVRENAHTRLERYKQRIVNAYNR